MSNPKIDEYGNKRWYKNNKLHRDNGPAIEFINGDKFWYKDGRLHRDNGPAIELINGDKHWYKNNERHREDGPAIEHNSRKYWFKNGIEITKEEIKRILSNPNSSPEELAPFKSLIEENLKCQTQK